MHTAECTRAMWSEQVGIPQLGVDCSNDCATALYRSEDTTKRDCYLQLSHTERSKVV